MESNEKKSNRLSWELNEKDMICTFPANPPFKTVFSFEKIVGYVKPENPIVFDLFRHGLKQKLADCVAGATKNGFSFEEQEIMMKEKWVEISTGVVKTRKNAKADPFAEARAKLEAMPDGDDKVAAMALAKMLGIVK